MNDHDLLWEVVDAAFATLALLVLPLVMLALYGLIGGAVAYVGGVLLVKT